MESFEKKLDEDNFGPQDGEEHYDSDEDEPAGRPQRGGVRQTPGWLSHSVVDREVAVRRQLYRAQARMYLDKQRAIFARLSRRSKDEPTPAQLASLWAGLQLVSDQDLRKQLREIDVFLARTTEGALKCAKAHDAATAQLDDEQLERIMRKQFLACLHTLTDEEWQLVDDVRATLLKLGPRPAALAARSGLRALESGRSLVPPEEQQLLRPGDKRRAPEPEETDDDE